MTDENKKIEKFIEKNQSLLTARNIDIARSKFQGDWFVYCDNKEFGYYEYFFKFTTAKELVDIITEELSFELNCCIDEDVVPPSFESESLAEDIQTFHPYD
jgi:hypothetical protein